MKDSQTPAFVDRARELVTSLGYDASLTALVNETNERRLRGGIPPPDYLRVTDIVNPATAYWSREKPIPIPPDLARRFAYGKAKHNEAAYWFSELPDFVLNEGWLDGGYVGVNGLLGKLDHLLGRSVLEFKTKHSAPRTPAKLLREFPQDLEQTLFYAALLPKASARHYLVFLDGQDSEFVAFRAEVRDRGPIINLVRLRMAIIREALDSKNPSPLGRCRYFDYGCRFRQAGVCGCGELAPLKTSALEQAVHIIRDEDFEGTLEQARLDAGIPADDILVWDLMSPRRRYLRRLGDAPA